MASHNNIFALVITAIFSFTLYKIIDGKTYSDNYRTLKISIGAITKDPERFVPDHLKTKKICKQAVENLPFVAKYVPDQYKINKCVIKFL